MVGADNKDKRKALLALMNTMLKLYFKLNTLRLCKPLIRSLEAPGFPPFESFPKAQRVTQKFYSGRLAIFEDQLVSPPLTHASPW